MILSKIEVLKSTCGVSLSKRSSQKRVFVCGINDEKFESFPKRRQQENESHIDRSIEREEEEEKAVVLIAQSTTFERPTNVCWCVRLVLFRVHVYLGCATTDL